LKKIEREGEFRLLITWKTYELHPKGLAYDLKMSYLSIDANEYVKQIWKRLEKIALDNNVPIAFPSVLSKSRLALEASEYARIQPEKYEKFHDSMFRAYFVEKKDIEKVRVILKIAEKAGLDFEDLKKELESGIYTDIIARSKQEAISYGISGVPAFIVGSKKKMVFTGCQPRTIFKEIFEDVYKKNQPS